jgi:hypothetical protein
MQSGSAVQVVRYNTLLIHKYATLTLLITTSTVADWRLLEVGNFVTSSEGRGQWTDYVIMVLPNRCQAEWPCPPPQCADV